MAEKTRVLFALEMVGTVNALKRSLGILERERNCELRFAASDVALTALTGMGRECITLERDPREVVGEFQPNVVVVGVSAFERDHKKWTGLELNYGLAAMDAGIPVVAYRDDSGIAMWSQELSAHPRSGELLTLLMFDRMTAQVVEGRQAKLIAAVGSGYYDALPTWDWAAARRESRAKIGIEDGDLVITFNVGADKERVLEALEPVVDGLLRMDAPVVFVAGFHPKDPDAPYVESPPKSGKYIARPSAPYDPVLERLEGSRVRVIREPVFRNAESDSQRRMAASDLIVMGPGSTDKSTALYGGIPQVIVGTPLTAEKVRSTGIEVEQFDFVHDGTVDIRFDADGLASYIEDFPAHAAHIREQARMGKEKYSAAPAAPRIAEAILTAAGVSSN